MTTDNMPLVEAKWLAERIDDPKVKVLDCSWYLPQEMRDPLVEYELAHIPGAVFLEWEACSGEGTSETALYLPTAEQFTTFAASLGITDDDMVVAYDAEGIHSIAGRAWWMFRVFGHENVALLDGGLTAWKAAGLDTVDTMPEITTVDRSPASINKNLVRTYDEMRANLITGADQMIDVRAAGRYLGTAESHDKRPGHIPGAVNLPVADLVAGENNTLLPAKEVGGLLEIAGVDLCKPTVAYCGGGGSSPVLALGAYLLGHKDMAIYDGAMEDWFKDDDAPVERAASEISN